MRRLSLAAATGVRACALLPGGAQAQSAVSEFPNGAGKDLVATVCQACHQTDQITRGSGYTKDDWRELIGTMVDLSAPRRRAT